MAKKMGWIAVGALAAWWWWPSSSTTVEDRPQAAVLTGGGYAIIEGGKRIVEYDAAGAVEHETAISMPADAHVVGMIGGVGAAYRDGKQVVIGRVGPDGELAKPERFGRNMAKMCEQTASNRHRFAVMWKEKDGQLWIVHGPTNKLTVEQVGLASSATDDDATRDDYCGVASAEQAIIMLARDGDRTYMVNCNTKRCGGAQTVKLDKKRAILGFGCAKDACAVVTKDGASVDVSWVWIRNGKVEWQKPLPTPGDSSHVSAVGIGAQVAVAYSVDPEPVVRVFDKTGTSKAIWQRKSDVVPALAWSGTELFVAARRDGEVETSIVKP